MQVWVTIGSMSFYRAQKTLDFHGPNPPPTCHRNGSARIKNITHGACFSPEADESSSVAKIGVGVGLRSALFCVFISLETDFPKSGIFADFLYIF
jgi:hypothetical protein